MEKVLCQIQQGIAEVRLNRPNKHNALDIDMFQSLVQCSESLMTRADLRAVILYGEGASFCAGLDFQSMMNVANAADVLLSKKKDQIANLAQQAAWGWMTLPVPVISVLHGAVFGGGLQIALACDFRFATHDTQLSVMETRWGLCPDMTLSQTLPKLVGIDVAKWLTYTSEVIHAEDAQRLGLITQIHDDPLEAARQCAQKIARRSPDAIRASKYLLNTAPNCSVDEAFKIEESLQKDLMSRPNQREAVLAEFQKREPRFIDPAVTKT